MLISMTLTRWDERNDDTGPREKSPIAIGQHDQHKEATKGQQDIHVGELVRDCGTIGCDHPLP
jgi:hypothetical protein